MTALQMPQANSRSAFSCSLTCITCTGRAGDGSRSRGEEGGQLSEMPTRSWAVRCAGCCRLQATMHTRAHAHLLARRLGAGAAAGHPLADGRLARPAPLLGLGVPVPPGLVAHGDDVALVGARLHLLRRLLGQVGLQAGAVARLCKGRAGRGHAEAERGLRRETRCTCHRLEKPRRLRQPCPAG